MTTLSTLSPEEQAAYRAGSEASASTDWRKHVNPYPRGSVLFCRWRDGFRDSSRCEGVIDL